jgi:hypothetical protein
LNLTKHVIYSFSLLHQSIFIRHYNNHNLPTIAWLREQVPETTKFLLHDTGIAKSSIKMLDPEFYERVVWVDWNMSVVIKNGTLAVPILSSHPMEQGKMRPMMSLRKWVKEKKETRPKKYVVFYSRKGAAHDRVLADEEQVLKRIKGAMDIYGMSDQELIVFTGKDADGRSLTTEEQYDLFRSAHTIIGKLLLGNLTLQQTFSCILVSHCSSLRIRIGSHGAGLLGNLAWIDPFPETCEEHTKVLEFINGEDSIQVQGNFAYISSYFNFRKWPMDYHALFYTAASTSKDTYIDQWALQDALTDMWGNKTVTKQA